MLCVHIQGITLSVISLLGMRQKVNGTCLCVCVREREREREKEREREREKERERESVCVYVCVCVSHACRSGLRTRMHFMV